MPVGFKTDIDKDGRRHWSDNSEDPIELPNGRKLITLRDAARFHRLDYKNLYFNGFDQRFRILANG